jgi:hypothetical protein
MIIKIATDKRETDAYRCRTASSTCDESFNK